MKDTNFFKSEFFNKCNICDNGYQEYVGECPYCEGTGYKLTELGKELLKVFKGYLFK